MNEKFSDAAPKTWYEPVPTPADFSEPDEVQWAATPLNPTHEKQWAMYAQFEQLFAHPYPNDVSPEFRELVEHDFLMGNASRETKNKAHYINWLNSHESHGMIAHRVMRASERAGDLHDLLDFVLTTDVRATEIAKLSVPYGYRMEYLPQLRQTVHNAIVAREGEILEQQPYGHMHVSPHFDDSHTSLVGILATYQRDVGHILAADEVVTVTERQALAIRVDAASGFDSNIKNALEHGSEKTRLRQIEKIEAMIQHDEPKEYMVPLSATFFAHRPKIASAEAIKSGRVDATLAKLALQSK